MIRKRLRSPCTPNSPPLLPASVLQCPSGAFRRRLLGRPLCRWRFAACHFLLPPRPVCNYRPKLGRMPHQVLKICRECCFTRYIDSYFFPLPPPQYAIILLNVIPQQLQNFPNSFKQHST